MSFREAIAGLGDNPVFRLDRRRAWRGAGAWLILLIGGVCCAHSGPVILAPVLAASSVVRDRQRRAWDDYLLTPLKAEEILAGKLVAALQVPAAMLVVGFVWTLLPGLLGLVGMWRTDPDEAMKLVVFTLKWDLAAAAAAAPAVVTGSLVGINAALGSQLRFSAVGGAVVVALLLQGAIAAVSVVAVWRVLLPPGQPLMGAMNSSLAAWAWTWVGALFLLGNVAASALLWDACRRAIRRSS